MNYAEEQLPLSEIQERLRSFADARDWNQFHSPKNLAMALAAEAGELLELFQWLTEEESRRLDEARLERVAEEIADIQIYLLRVADVLGISIPAAVEDKLKVNEAKYPVSRARGSAAKYSERDS